MESVPDPLVQNRIQVDFGITVPAYQSDALQVRLVWGGTDVTASWVGDELWSTSLELPTNTRVNTPYRLLFRIGMATSY